MPGKGCSTRRLISALNSGGGSMMGLPSERSKTFSGPNCFFMAMPSSNMRRIQEPTSMPFLTLDDTDTFDFLSAHLESGQVDFTYFFRQPPDDALLPGRNIDRCEHREAPQHEDVESADVAELLRPPGAVDEVYLLRPAVEGGGDSSVVRVGFLPPADREGW